MIKEARGRERYFGESRWEIFDPLIKRWLCRDVWAALCFCLPLMMQIVNQAYRRLPRSLLWAVQERLTESPPDGSGPPGDLGLQWDRCASALHSYWCVRAHLPWVPASFPQLSSVQRAQVFLLFFTFSWCWLGTRQGNSGQELSHSKLEFISKCMLTYIKNLVPCKHLSDGW